MQVKLISKTTGVNEFENRSIDEIIVGIARVSSNRKDLFKNPEKLLRYCVLEQHWSILESCYLGFEVITSRAISQEILRHKSMSFQEFSLRYSAAIATEPIEIRKQSESNRQSSTEVFDAQLKNQIADYKIQDLITDTVDDCLANYSELLDNEVARECARMILPLATQTKIYVTGNIRSWVTFLNARLHKTAQKEIRLVAEAIRDEFIVQCPIISDCFFNFDNAYNIHILERLVLEKYGVYQQCLENIEKSSES